MTRLALTFLSFLGSAAAFHAACPPLRGLPRPRAASPVCLQSLDAPPAADAAQPHADRAAVSAASAAVAVGVARAPSGRATVVSGPIGGSKLNPHDRVISQRPRASARRPASRPDTGQRSLPRPRPRSEEG